MLQEIKWLLLPLTCLVADADAINGEQSRSTPLRVASDDQGTKQGMASFVAGTGVVHGGAQQQLLPSPAQLMPSSDRKKPQGLMRRAAVWDSRGNLGSEAEILLSPAVSNLTQQQRTPVQMLSNWTTPPNQSLPAQALPNQTHQHVSNQTPSRRRERRRRRKGRKKEEELWRRGGNQSNDTPALTPAPTPGSTDSSAPTQWPTLQPTAKPTPQPTAEPTPQPTPLETSTPLHLYVAPTPVPTPLPTPAPTCNEVCYDVCYTDKCVGTWTNSIPSNQQWTSKGYNGTGCCSPYHEPRTCETCCKCIDEEDDLALR